MTKDLLTTLLTNNIMTSINKNVALLVGLAAIASVSTAYALMQNGQSPQEVQAEHSGFLGHVTLAVYGPDGNIKAYRQTDNLVVTNGDNATANKMFFGSNVGRKLSVCTGCTGANVGTFQYIGVGTGNTAVTANDIGLSGATTGSAGNQASNKRISTSIINGTTQHGTVQLSTTWPANRLSNSSTVNIQEAGLFDAAGNFTNTANMFARQTFSAIGVNPADTLQITWTITIT